MSHSFLRLRLDETPCPCKDDAVDALKLLYRSCYLETGPGVAKDWALKTFRPLFKIAKDAWEAGLPAPSEKLKPLYKFRFG